MGREGGCIGERQVQGAEKGVERGPQRAVRSSGERGGAEESTQAEELEGGGGVSESEAR